MLALPVLVLFCAVSAGVSCGIAQYNDTLGYLDASTVTKVAASSPQACCAQCVATPACVSWSWSGATWTPRTPCHMSPLDFTGREQTKMHSGLACGSARTAPPPPSAVPGTFVIDTTPSGRRQVFEGVEVELQSDSIGTNNNGMPMDGELVPDADPSTIGAPHDLTPSERARFATEIVKGVRTVRLALGLFLRGSPDNKSIVGRWPSQMAELKALQDASGIDGWAPEYWSPPPGWKSNHSYYGGTLASFAPAFLSSFADSVVRDVEYLRAKGLRVTWWGLQNEPNFTAQANVTCPPANESQRRAFVRAQVGGGAARGRRAPYAMCQYTQCAYYHAFMACAKKIRAYDASIRIHTNSWNGQLGAAPIALDPKGLALVDGACVVCACVDVRARVCLCVNMCVCMCVCAPILTRVMIYRSLHAAHGELRVREDFREQHADVVVREAGVHERDGVPAQFAIGGERGGHGRCGEHLSQYAHFQGLAHWSHYPARDQAYDQHRVAGVRLGVVAPDGLKRERRVPGAARAALDAELLELEQCRTVHEDCALAFVEAQRDGGSPAGAPARRCVRDAGGGGREGPAACAHRCREAHCGADERAVQSE